jgi:hypothetical protein
MLLHEINVTIVVKVQHLLASLMFAVGYAYMFDIKCHIMHACKQGKVCSTKGPAVESTCSVYNSCLQRRRSI